MLISLVKRIIISKLAAMEELSLTRMLISSWLNVYLQDIFNDDGDEDDEEEQDVFSQKEIQKLNKRLLALLKVSKRNNLHAWLNSNSYSYKD